MLLLAPIPWFFTENSFHWHFTTVSKTYESEPWLHSEQNSQLHSRARLKGELWSCTEQYKQVINQARRAMGPAPVTSSSGQTYCTTARWEGVRQAGGLQDFFTRYRLRNVRRRQLHLRCDMRWRETWRRGRPVWTSCFDLSSVSSNTNWTRTPNQFGLSPRDKNQ